MISLDIEKNLGDNVNGFYGLSTDTKPINSFNGVQIHNGYYFYEMDTQDIYMFDAESKTWIKQ